MAPVIASIVVGRPAAEVFAYATDPAHFHEWQQGLIEGHLDPPGPAPANELFNKAVIGFITNPAG